MRSKLASFLLHLLGWRVPPESIDVPDKALIVMAPHTSNWDFVYGRLGLSSMGVKNVKFLIKKEAFFFPLGLLLRALGGLPVDRSKTVSTVAQVSNMFHKHKKMLLVITPEGTRKYNETWKKGFYNIAKDAGVPLITGYLNYKDKIGGLGFIIENPGTATYEEILEQVQAFYRGAHAKFPDNFNLSSQYLEEHDSSQPTS